MAKTASCLTIWSTSPHIASFSGRLSVIASITKSQSARSRYSTVPWIRPRTASASSAEERPFSTALASCFSIFPIPFPSAASSTSRSTTW